ncbi:MAG TPA: hypothetical protein VL346_09355, partial [Acidobacteriaceae bacterium]|nr:hypothetical protein [Acidobacteriaceae bacterium]
MSPALHTSEGNDSSRGDREQGGVCIGFLLSRYPAVSHTFFLKEVLGLRERGIAVPVASIN